MGNVTFSVDLQDPISYSFYILITGVALMLISAVIYIAFFRLWKVQRDENGLVKAKRTPGIILARSKLKYVAQLGRLEKALYNNEVGERESYQELSRIIRMFAKDATGLSIENYTLAEIKALRRNDLISLMEVYSAPEFSRYGRGDLSRDISDTKRAIQTWR